MAASKPPYEIEPDLREHTYDGIREYDQRLPNWWLWTLYVTIIYSAVYWVTWYQSEVALSDGDRVQAELDRIETVKLAASVNVLDNDNLWEMSRNDEFVLAGREIYNSTCVACHGQNLEGGIGQNLIDDEWLHGGRPIEIFRIVRDGVEDKGMQAWDNILGSKKIAEVTAFILSHHTPPSDEE